MRQMQTFCALQLQLQSCRLVVGVLCVVLRGPAYLRSAWPCFFCVSARLYALLLRVGNFVCRGRSKAWEDGKDGSERRRWCACCMAVAWRGMGMCM
jgi:hypothetical protein